MFKEIIKNYSSRLGVLRDFVAYVDPLLRKRAEDVEGAHGDLAGEDVRELLLLLALPESKILEKLSSGKLNVKLRLAANVEKARSAPKPSRPANITVIRPFSSLNPEEATKFNVLARQLQQHLEAISRPQVHISHLYESSLISLVSTTEWFLARVLHALFQRFPGKLESEKTFTISQLKTLGSVEKIIEDATDSKVEGILQKSVEDQLSYLRKAFGNIDLSFIDQIFSELVEIHARRNLFIHNGGTVNQRYLERVQAAGSLGDPPAVGTRLTVDKMYLDRAINVFENVFVHLAMAIWKQLDPKDKDRSFLIDQVIEQIIAGHSETAEAWSEFTMKDSGLLRVARLRAKFNYWQAHKWDGRFEEVRSAVEKEDLSIAPSVFQIAQYALLDDADSFFALLPKAIKDRGLTISDLGSWPLFRGMREDSRYENFLEEAKVSVEPGKVVKATRARARKKVIVSKKASTIKKPRRAKKVAARTKASRRKTR